MITNDLDVVGMECRYSGFRVDDKIKSKYIEKITVDDGVIVKHKTIQEQKGKKTVAFVSWFVGNTGYNTMEIALEKLKN